jgi:hypothetical protein
MLESAKSSLAPAPAKEQPWKTLKGAPKDDSNAYVKKPEVMGCNGIIRLMETADDKGLGG